MAVEVTKNTFDQEVKNSEKKVLVDFYAIWCGPCKMISPILEDIAKEREDISVVKVDVDKEPELAREFNVMSIPTLVLFKNGEAKKTWVGLRSKEALIADIEAVN